MNDFDAIIIVLVNTLYIIGVKYGLQQQLKEYLMDTFQRHRGDIW